MKKSAPRISVFNRQRKVPIETRLLRQFLARVASRLAPGSSFSVVLLSDRAMTGYNHRFRGLRESTDVLSFPGSPQPGEEAGYRGDILISVEAADRQKTASLVDEIKSLSLHGLLHLLGYDHGKDQGRMDKLERRLRREFRLP